MKVITSPHGWKYFCDVNQGDLYRTENGSSIYMKVKAANINAVAIDSGFTFKHNDNYKVWPVEGAFHEAPKA